MRLIKHNIRIVFRGYKSCVGFNWNNVNKYDVSVTGACRYESTGLNARITKEKRKVFDGFPILDEFSKRSHLTRWEKEKKSRAVRWRFLEHRGPVFAPPHVPLPKHVKFLYDGVEINLSSPAEEAAVYYAKMLNHEYTSETLFNNNFFQDWKETMNEEESAVITDFSKCNFQQIHKYFLELSEKQKLLSRDDKKRLQESNQLCIEKYGYCFIDGRKEKISNFKLEPPDLFRGRGKHPKMGKLKKRIEAEDVTINCSEDSKIPEPPLGHQWKEIRHDPTVVWLAAWNDKIQNKVKYIMLNPCSKVRSEMDLYKYETAKKLHKYIDKIRKRYQKEWKSKDMLKKQQAVALYFIDQLALRAGNEKDEDELDTAGCCSLRTGHIKLHMAKNNERCLVLFDFIGKDAIRYYNEVPVERAVFENLKLFMMNKQPNDYLFDLLNTYKLNKYLNKTMKNLTAKVFRTYNASSFFQKQLSDLTKPDDNINEKLQSYNRANRAVAILCNHQRSVSKSHENQIENIVKKIEIKNKKKLCLENELHNEVINDTSKRAAERQRITKKLNKIDEHLQKLEMLKMYKDENKTVALGTSKLNYIDPRITVAWCKKYNVPIEKIYNKTEREKFHWALDTGPDFQF